MDLSAELKKIYFAAVLACVLLVLFLLVEPPITILAWGLVIAALLLVVYVTAANFNLFKKIQKERGIQSNEGSV